MNTLAKVARLGGSNGERKKTKPKKQNKTLIPFSSRGEGVSETADSFLMAML